MKLARQILFKALALAGLVVIFKWTGKEGSHHTIDMRAALLVFCAPILIWTLFQKQNIIWTHVFRRLKEHLKFNTDEISGQLDQHTFAARGQFGFSQVLKLSENHPDSMLRYAGELFSARFSSREISQLLIQKIQTEDEQWQALSSTFGFLAKMAPYFGMLATVMGMIQLLDNMNDFTRISGSMALAMQGTLFGLISFTLVYSPFQRFFAEIRADALKRNELIARWFVLVSQQTDPDLIRQELRSCRLESPELLKTRIIPAPSGEAMRSSS